MFSRSLVVLKRSSSLYPFATFFRLVNGSLTKTNAPQRMRVASALWFLTTPRYENRNDPSRTSTALQLYQHFGNSVISKAAKLKAKSNVGGLKAQKHAKRAVKIDGRRARKRSTGQGVRRKATKPARTYSLSTFTKVVTGETEAVSGKRAILRAIYQATRGIPSASKRVAIAKEILKLSTTTTAPSAGRRSKPSRAVTPTTAGRGGNSAYKKFCQTLIRRGNLKLSKSLARRLRRLWILTSTQNHLSERSREDMALRFLQKSQGKGKKRLIKKKLKKTVARRATKSQKKATGKKAQVLNRRSGRKPPLKVSKKQATKTGMKVRDKVKRVNKKTRKPYPRRNPFLKFYRAMVLTGHIPNHPKGIRAQRIQELWDQTHHLKSFPSKVKLATAYLTGAQTMPKLTRAQTASMVKNFKKKAIKPRKSAKAQGRRVGASAKSRSFKVPSLYKVNPFIGTYQALWRQAPGRTSVARMRAISTAWNNSKVSGEVDRRTPRQRIQAVAKELENA